MTPGVTINITKETEPTRNQQIGQTGLYIKTQGVKLTIPLSIGGFSATAKYVKADPDAVVGATGGDYKNNSGVKISGITVLIYAKDTDNTNETDIPNFINDDDVQIFYDAAVSGDTEKAWAGVQNTLTLKFDTLANSANKGSGRGMPGSFGTFEKVS